MSASARSVLVTGATGLVGAAVVRQLLAAGRPVRVLRRAASRLDLLGDAAARVEHAVGDVTDAASVRAAVRGAGAVVHAAARVSFGRAERVALWQTNVQGTAHVVAAASAEGVGRLVNVSSIAALGRPAAPGGPIDEGAVWTRADTPYAHTKHAAERLVAQAAAEGLPALSVHPALIFGPGRADEGTGRVVARVARGQVRAAPPGGTAVVDVEDVAAAILAALTRGAPGGRYVLAADSLPWIDILGTLARAFGVPPPRRTLPRAALVAAGALAEAWSALAGRPAGLTRATARTSAETYVYPAARAEAVLGVRFRPFADTAARLAAR